MGLAEVYSANVQMSVPDLVLLHGWGMNHKVWDPLCSLLEPHFSLHLPDLPGHGDNQVLPNGTQLSDWSDSIAEQVPDHALWVAWSLGGLLALNIAAHKADKVSGLVVVGGTPKFVQADDWFCATPKSVFDQFAVSLERQVDGTMQRFLALVAAGSDNPRATLKQLKQIYQAVLPNPHALSIGLELLRASDLRSQLSKIVCPLLFLNAQNDHLIPSVLSDGLKSYLTTRSELVEACGHALFLTKPEWFAHRVITFFSGESHR